MELEEGTGDMDIEPSNDNFEKVHFQTLSEQEKAAIKDEFDSYK
jgi:hypothetical protein